MSPIEYKHVSFNLQGNQEIENNWRMSEGIRERLWYNASDIRSMASDASSSTIESDSRSLIMIMDFVALVSILGHILVDGTISYRASGASYVCILLSSLVSASTGKTPLAPFFVLWMYMGQLVCNTGGVSNNTHLKYGIIGSAAGYYVYRQRTQKKLKETAEKMLQDRKKRAEILQAVSKKVS